MHPFQDAAVPAGAVGIAWYGQNSFALRDPDGTTVLVDPYFPHDRPAEKFIHAEPPLDEAQLRTDFVLLTHDHSDHTCTETLLRIHQAHPGVVYVGPVESIDRLRAAGIGGDLLRPIAAGASAELAAMVVRAVWSKPPGGAPADGIDPPGAQHLGSVIRPAGGRPGVYVTGDLIHTFAEHEELLRPVADLAPDIGLLTTHPTEGEFPFFDGSVKMAERLGLKAVVPAHYDCFVKRTYDPAAWAARFGPGGPERIIIPYGGWVVYPPAA